MITNKMLKSRKNMATMYVLQFIFAYSKKIRLCVKCMPKLEIVFGFSDTTTIILVKMKSIKETFIFQVLWHAFVSVTFLM